MKINKFIILLSLALGVAMQLGVNSARATEPSLRFSAVNAGYTDENKVQQNYDFIEIESTGGSVFALGEYKIIYTNSTGKIAGEINFDDGWELAGTKLVMGSKHAPQYNDAPKEYLYNFGSTGLAGTAGKLTLLKNEIAVDEVCWGSLTCTNASWLKFASKQTDNFSMKLGADGEFGLEKYYPEINQEAMRKKIQTEAEKELGPGLISCEGLIFTEIYSYFENSYDEQFVEIYNAGWSEVVLDNCFISYKNKSFVLSGELGIGEYLAYKNAELRLTKNPSSSNELLLIDVNNEIVDIAVYANGQKKGRSWNLMDFDDAGKGIWMQSFRITPGHANIYQEYKSCMEGKIINPSTGNCINASEEELAPCPEGKFRNPETGRCKSYANLEKILAPCKEGYFRNPETNRCNKIASLSADTKTPCKDGYERNSETGRCRKIRANVGADYAVDRSEYDTTSTFLAYGALTALLVGGAIYVVFQFRKELKRYLKNRFGDWQIWRFMSILSKRAAEKMSGLKRLLSKFRKKDL